MIWLASAALAGAFTKDLGEAYVKAGVDVYRASRFRAPGQVEDSTGRYTGTSPSLYGEAGLLSVHPLQLSVSAPLVVGSHRTSVFDAFGELPARATTVRMGDLRAAVQTAVHPELPLAVGVEGKVPLYRNDSVGQDLPIYAELFPKPGDGQVDLTFWGFGGGSVGKGFFEGGLGYLHRTEWFIGWDTPLRFADGGRAQGKVGWQAGPMLALAGLEAQWAWRLPLGDVYTRQFLAGSVSALIDVAEGLAVEPRLGAELWALNASQGFSAGLGLSWRR